MYYLKKTYDFSIANAWPNSFEYLTCRTFQSLGVLKPFFIFQQETKDAMGINTYQFSLLYAWYSWPNVILPLVGGYMMDSVFGIRLGTIIFAAFIILGKIYLSFI